MIVYMFINSSVEMTLNRFERVNGVRYMNDDAENSLSEIKLKGKKITYALEAFSMLMMKTDIMTVRVSRFI